MLRRSEIVDLTAASLAPDMLTLVKMGDAGLVAANEVRPPPAATPPRSLRENVQIRRRRRRPRRHAGPQRSASAERRGPTAGGQVWQAPGFEARQAHRADHRCRQAHLHRHELCRALYRAGHGAPPPAHLRDLGAAGLRAALACTVQPVPTEPVVFNKFPSTICGSGDVVPKDPETNVRPTTAHECAGAS